MADFVVVGLKWESADDELWEIWLDRDPYVVEFGPVCLQDYGCVEEIMEIFGQRLGERILRAYGDGDLTVVKGRKALEILKAIDDYMREEFDIETSYLGHANDLVVYKLNV
jgi:hypothetical protein